MGVTPKPAIHGFPTSLLDSSLQTRTRVATPILAVSSVLQGAARHRGMWALAGAAALLSKFPVRYACHLSILQQHR